MRWCVSCGVRSSLGWIPFKARSLAYRGGQLRFRVPVLSKWDSYGLGAYELSAGSFSEDARGRWYLNVAVKVKKTPLLPTASHAVGLDPGLKELFRPPTVRS